MGISRHCPLADKSTRQGSPVEEAGNRKGEAQASISEQRRMPLSSLPGLGLIKSYVVKVRVRHRDRFFRTLLGHRWCFSGWFYQGGTVVFRDVPVFRGAIQPCQNRFSRRKRALLRPDFALKDCFHGGLSRRYSMRTSVLSPILSAATSWVKPSLELGNWKQDSGCGVARPPSRPRSHPDNPPRVSSRDTTEIQRELQEESNE
jgi:hypothetical protein